MKCCDNDPFKIISPEKKNTMHMKQTQKTQTSKKLEIGSGAKKE